MVAQERPGDRIAEHGVKEEFTTPSHDELNQSVHAEAFNSSVHS